MLGCSLLVLAAALPLALPSGAEESSVLLLLGIVLSLEAALLSELSELLDVSGSRGASRLPEEDTSVGSVESGGVVELLVASSANACEKLSEKLRASAEGKNNATKAITTSKNPVRARRTCEFCDFSQVFFFTTHPIQGPVLFR